ncbi:MAG: glycosyl hydrolase, partial [Verrucomicrobiota bacterium]|nr:glycosyl hydrolase [Verrucomicrobiota bacterium]
LFIHNRTESQDIYFLSNQDDACREFTGSFRVSGRFPSLWHPEDGRTTPVLAYDDDGVRTRIPLGMEPFGSVFVVFGKKDLGLPKRMVFDGEPVVSEPMDLSGDWSVSFDETSGIGTVDFPALVSWTEHDDERIKYYSGEAVYERSFELPDAVLSAGDPVVLDLGLLSAMAEVHLNGKPIGILWKPPYRLDVTKQIHSGINRLEVTLVNTWFNRLFYEIVKNPDGPHLLDLSKAPAVKTLHNSIKNRPLMPSGLFGPVRLVFGARNVVQ